jgi:hypothetical protein
MPNEISAALALEQRHVSKKRNANKKRNGEQEFFSWVAKKNKNVGVQLWWRSLALLEGGLRQGHAKSGIVGRGVGGLALLAKLVLSVGRAHLVLPVHV